MLNVLMIAGSEAEKRREARKEANEQRFGGQFHDWGRLQ